VHEHVANLMLMADVRALGDEVRANYEHIDVLANNAGAVFASRKETSEGIEQTFALNHLAPFLLTNLLRDRLAGGQVVTTASDAHKAAATHEADRVLGRADQTLIPAGQFDALVAAVVSVCQYSAGRRRAHRSGTARGSARRR
jgi:NAD(P)-dependent dehydrogenase (short-subunit alcohol dehydrogenase family)